VTIVSVLSIALNADMKDTIKADEFVRPSPDRYDQYRPLWARPWELNIAI